MDSAPAAVAPAPGPALAATGEKRRRILQRYHRERRRCEEEGKPAPPRPFPHGNIRPCEGEWRNKKRQTDRRYVERRKKAQWAASWAAEAVSAVVSMSEAAAEAAASSGHWPGLSNVFPSLPAGATYAEGKVCTGVLFDVPYRLCGCGQGVCASSLLLDQRPARIQRGSRPFCKSSQFFDDSRIPDELLSAATASIGGQFDALTVRYMRGATLTLKDGSLHTITKSSENIAIDAMAEPRSNERVGMGLCYGCVPEGAVLPMYGRTHGGAASSTVGADPLLTMRHMTPEVYALLRWAARLDHDASGNTMPNVAFFNKYERRPSGRSAKIAEHTDSRPARLPAQLRMRLASAVLCVTTKAEAPMSFCTRDFSSRLPSCALEPVAQVRARLHKGSAYVYSMRDDHAAKHMVYFLPPDVDEFTGKHPTDAQQAGPVAVRENFVFREMTDFGIFRNEDDRIVRTLKSA